jgi:hypothetical protein
MALVLERGFSVRSARLQQWETLFEEWILTVERFCRLSPGDAPYWYTERANVGLLAGAAWRCGWIALEEFQSDKSAQDLGWRGRLDLWLSSAAESYLVEAKQAWPYLGDATGITTATRALNEAHADAVNLVLTEPELRIGVAFCSPYHQFRSQRGVEDELLRLLAEVQQIQCDAMAWCFPAATRALVDRRGETVHPGVLLLARVVTDAE